MKIVEDDTGENLPDLGLSKELIKHDNKLWLIKGNIDKVDVIKIKNLNT